MVKSRFDINTVIQSYNKEYTIVDDNNWKTNINGLHLICKLEYNNDGIAFFRWRIKPKY